MKRKRWCCAWMLLACPAWAGWTGVHEDGNSAAYGDTSTVVREGGQAIMWTLIDYRTPRRLVELAYRSQKSRVEYRCSQSEARVLGVTLHAGAMGEGRTVYEDPSEQPWAPVEPDSVSAKLLAAACR